jgi:hypothetical protein
MVREPEVSGEEEWGCAAAVRIWRQRRGEAAPQVGRR